MAVPDFAHLHVHTEYSMLDGAVRIADLMRKVSESGMKAVGMTDHGVLYGAVEFYKEAQKAGVKPLLGCEMYVAPGSMHEKKSSSGKDAAYHLTVLAETNEGWANLIKLVSAAHLEGFYYKPRIDKDLLARNAKGLIGLSGCLKGEISSAILDGNPKRGRDLTAQYRDIFGAGNFFVEIHDHGMDAQREVNSHLLRWSGDLGLGLVAANDVHFLERSHHEAHDVMVCIGTGANVTDERRLRYVPELYLKTPAEMAEIFRDHPDALSNTARIAERCDVTMEFGKSRFPVFHPPEGKTREGYLRELCEEGFRRRYGKGAPELAERLDYELGVLQKLGFTSYFLIVWDFIRFAKERGIPVGPGRGSAAGSMVAYVLGITDLDPVRYGLIFERFLNPERVSPPDIDVDFCQARRGEVIEYVRQKYGERCVSQIVTFNQLGAKSVVRDVARVLGMSYGEGDRIAKMIPNELNITLETAKEKNPELKQAIQSEPATQQLWSYSTVLEGLSRNAGIHAAGVVIGDRDLSEIVPLCRGKENEVVTQYSMEPLTDLGMLKMDFLGLKTLTVMRDAEGLIRRKIPDFDIEKVPVDDKEAFDILNRGETVGIFQFEGGMSRYCRNFGFASLDDMNALCALYRPGPMALIPDYIKRKRGETKINYDHPLLEKVAKETYGILIYQEQVQQAANLLAGYSLGQADLLRRAMGKKDKEKMAKEREVFIEGCKTHNSIPEKKAAAIFDLLEKFADYGFNKSHSAAYSLISYRMCWLKAHHPVEFMCAVLSNEVDDTDKISFYVDEAKRMGLAILPPDLNKSLLKFAPEEHEGKMAIRFGLSGIKNVGEAAMAEAVKEREARGPFASIEDFAARMDPRAINRKSMECLVKCGAFDFTGEERAQMVEDLEPVLAASASAHRDRNAGQQSLFGSETIPVTAKAGGRRRARPFEESELLSFEKELLGFYVTAHPLDPYRGTLDNAKFTKVRALEEMDDRVTLTVAGLLDAVEKKFTKSTGKPCAFLALEDLTGKVEVRVWSEAFEKYAGLLVPGKVVQVTGRLDKRDDKPAVTASEIKVLPPTPGSEKPVILRLAAGGAGRREVENVRAAVLDFPGRRPLVLEFVARDGRTMRVRAAEQFKVGNEQGLREALNGLLAN
ncbi:MAG: DNA polymerase III subunit alpha [Chthoniobacterales bacterium]|nr:DNA polymerase III subunit alpha [Chthoniobacterales bacterium]